MNAAAQREERREGRRSKVGNPNRANRGLATRFGCITMSGFRGLQASAFFRRSVLRISEFSTCQRPFPGGLTLPRWSDTLFAWQSQPWVEVWGRYWPATRSQSLPYRPQSLTRSRHQFSRCQTRASMSCVSRWTGSFLAPFQPRKEFLADSLRELADSIKEQGIVQPLIVRERNGHLELIAGERRWRAAHAGVDAGPSDRSRGR